VIAIILFIVVLLLCITIHELGHFLVARRYGIHARQFFVGFGPTVWSTTRGETEYGVKLLPLGGFVRISGMTADDRPEGVPEERLYFRAPRHHRFATIFAGPATNLVLAVLFTWGALAVAELPAMTEDFEPLGTNEVMVQEGSQAEAAGLADGDRITAVDGQPVEVFQDLEGVLPQEAGDEVAVSYVRDGEERTAAVEGWEGPPLGVAPAEVLTVDHSAGEALGETFVGSYSLPSQTGLLFSALGSLFDPGYWEARFTAPESQEAVEGPVSIVGAGQVFALGIGEGAGGQMLLLLGQLNLALAILNLLPLTPFDGGHLAVTLIEGARARLRRDGRETYIDPAKLWPLTAAVLALVLVLAGTLIVADLVQPIVG